MNHKKNYSLLSMVLTIVLLITNVTSTSAQTPVTIGETLQNLHIEAGIGAGTPTHSLMPIDIPVSMVYQFTPRFSAQLLSRAQYFLPKDGMTDKYNYAYGLGGGIGFAPFPIDSKEFGTYEIRANFTASIGNSDYKNMGYGIGLNWRGNTRGPRRCLVPLLGIEYRVHDFNLDGMKTSMGFYLTFGMRF